MNARPRVIIVGCGYVGSRLAERLRADHDVVAIVRSEASRNALAHAGIDACIINLDAEALSLSRLEPVLDGASVFYFTPPPNNGRGDSRVARFLDALTAAGATPRALIYMSTTGVYGDQQGTEVDETTPVRPRTDRAWRRVDAERQVHAWCEQRNVRCVVLRVPGIYGPGRLPLERLQRREPFVREQEAGISNRIHVEDLVSACIAAMNTARGIFNVTDGNSMSATQFARRVAVLAGLPAPVEVSLAEARKTFATERLSFIEESRRVSNRRMLRELGVHLRYAEVDEGIRACLTEG